MATGHRSGRRRVAPLLVAAALVAAACTAPAEVPLVRFPVGAGGPSLVTAIDADTVGPLHLDGTHLVDADGRVVLLHGVNAVVKQAPWYPQIPTQLGPADETYFRDNGFNAVRLGVWFSQLEPQPGVIDTAYLDRVSTVVDWFEARHIWVLFDFHQDVYWGMPDWATSPAAAALSDVAPDWAKAVGWGAAYLSPRSIQQWTELYADATIATDPTRHLWDALSEGAAAMATRFASRANTVGIELLNEPFPTDYPRCVLGGCPDIEARLAAMYEQMTTSIRSVAPDLPVWWEPASSAPGWGDTALPAPSQPGVGFAWHTYCYATDGGTLDPASDFDRARCGSFIPTSFDRAQRMSAGWDRPQLMTEFGASKNPLDATLVTREADARMVSWFHWHHYFQGTSGGLLPPEEVQAQLTRVYPQATAGVPLSMAFDPATGAFEYHYRPDATATAATSIVVPARHYPDGYVANVSGGIITSAPNSGRLQVEATPGATEVTVTVARA